MSKQLFLSLKTHKIKKLTMFLHSYAGRSLVHMYHGGLCLISLEVVSFMFSSQQAHSKLF